MQYADDTAKENINKDLEHIQQQWFQIVGQLEGRRHELEGILAEWTGMEDCMEDVLGWLKDMRLAIACDLPHHYDDLNTYLQQCNVRYLLVLYIQLLCKEK